MKITEIKKGKWYQTKFGIGVALSVGGTRPPSVMVNIVSPIPLGRRNMSPREVTKEIEPPNQA